MNSGNEQVESTVPTLTLFVTGDAPRSRRARKHLNAALETIGRDSVKSLEIDLLEHPEQSINHSVFATPALLRTEDDGEISILYGDLSDEGKLLDFLGKLDG
ncbi:MAG: circadian clock KaiB family protein [Wenzhouxiangellaceae bacterium]